MPVSHQVISRFVEQPNVIDACVGRNVASLRRSRRLSQGDLARLLGVTPDTVDAYEAGRRRIDAAMLLRLRTVIGAPVSAFFAGLS